VDQQNRSALALKGRPDCSAKPSGQLSIRDLPKDNFGLIGKTWKFPLEGPETSSDRSINRPPLHRCHNMPQGALEKKAQPLLRAKVVSRQSSNIGNRFKGGIPCRFKGCIPTAQASMDDRQRDRKSPKNRLRPTRRTPCPSPLQSHSTWPQVKLSRQGHSCHHL